MAEPVVIVAYDQGRPATFANVCDRARRALGEVAQPIEHIGSTSVPVSPPSRSSTWSWWCAHRPQLRGSTV